MNTYPPEMIVPSYVRTGKDEPTQTEISVLNDYVGIFPFIEFQEVEAMRSAGRIARKVCEFAGTLVKPGVTLDYIDKTVVLMIGNYYRLTNMQ